VTISTMTTGTTYLRAIATALVVATVPLLATSASASQDMQDACKLIETEVRDCACAVQFLKQHLGERKGALLLKLWAAGEGRLGDHARAIRAIYREHGERSVLDANSSFLDVRVDFLVQCQPSEFLEEPTLFEMGFAHSMAVGNDLDGRFSVTAKTNIRR
jgi:hypothetical protein